jgi:Ca-activated chloride channel homolog
VEEITVNFGNSRVLWLSLVILPLLALFLWGTWRKRQALIRQFVQNKTLAQLTLGISPARQKFRRVLLFLSTMLLLLAIAQPQWGFTWEEASQRGRDIVIAIDTSRSMLAEDIQPNRLARARLAALDLLTLGKFDRFGLVAFAGSAFLQCPLTFDDEAFRQSVQILEPGIIPQGGTALAQAIDAARDAYSKDAEDNHKILILFTDGEDHEQQINATVERAAGEGIKIFTVGVGTPSGELLRIRDERGNLVYVKDDAGNVVKSRLNEQILQQIATTGNGFYLPLQGGNAMEILYQKGLAPLPTSERTTKLMKRLKEQYYWPLSIAILLLILEVFVPDQKRARREKPILKGAATAASLLLLLLSVPLVNATPAKAQRQYNAGEYKSALSTYQELLSRSPNDPRLHYNAGAAAYQARKFDQAVKEFQAAAASPDLDLQQQSFYNVANAEFRLGESSSDPKERTALWEQALQHYEAALKLNANDKDAQFNRELVRKKLEELKKEQPQPQSQQQDKNKDNKEQKDQSDQEQKSNEDKEKDKESEQDQKSQEQKEKEKQQQQEQQDQQQSDSQKKEAEDKANQPRAQQGGQNDASEQKPENEGSGEVAQLGKMTPAQARQLLDAQRSEEKALLFIPQERKSSNQNRSFKDW